MQFVTGYPDDWKPAHFQQVATIGVSRAFLRERGMVFTSGEDELGRFDECVVSVDGIPFVLQQYVQPTRGGFGVEVPREFAADSSEVSRRLSALLNHLGVEVGEVVWHHADVDIQLSVPTPPDDADTGGVTVWPSLKAALQVARDKVWLAQQTSLLEQYNRLHDHHAHQLDDVVFTPLYASIVKDCTLHTWRSDNPLSWIERKYAVSAAIMSDLNLNYVRLRDLQLGKAEVTVAEDKSDVGSKPATGGAGGARTRGGRRHPVKVQKS
ncbi:TPA: hypothetical protein ACUNF5_001621 [Burkholderia orbicola]